MKINFNKGAPPPEPPKKSRLPRRLIFVVLEGGINREGAYSIGELISNSR